MQAVFAGFSSKMRRLGPAWAAVPALLGAIAALALPGTTSPATAEAAMLAVGALALLAGHTWGLLVALSSHVPLVGRVWPALANLHAHAHYPAASNSTVAAGAVAIVMVTAVPVVILSMMLFPRLLAHVVPGASPKVQSWATITVAVVLGASLVLPAVLA
jgi:hypothetical protein